MGRILGDLVLYVGICGGVEFIIILENLINKDKLILILKKYNEEGRCYVIIVVIE